MFGSYRVTPTSVDDLPELRRFLIAGFAEPPSAGHFSDAALRWKYFEPCGVEFGARSYVARAGGHLVGHVGMVPRSFVTHRADGDAPMSTGALHFIDLLASPAHPTAGLSLMKRGFAAAPIQFALGGSADGKDMAKATGYGCRSTFPVLEAVLNPAYRLRAPRVGWIGRVERFAWDLARSFVLRGSKPVRPLRLERVVRFGDEVAALAARGPAPLVCTARSADLLNYYLRYPCAEMSGFGIFEGKRQVGFALLSIVGDRTVRRGKIVECFLESNDQGIDADLWHGAVTELRRELKAQRADLASCYASTPWLQTACLEAGFVARRQPQQFFLRDPGGRLPADVPYHLTCLEADHGYL